MSAPVPRSARQALRAAESNVALCDKHVVDAHAACEAAKFSADTQRELMLAKSEQVTALRQLIHAQADIIRALDPTMGEPVKPPEVKFTRGAVWSSSPPGVLIHATAEAVQVESGGGILLGMRLHRPDAMVLADKAIVARFGPKGTEEMEMTPEQARVWAAEAKLQTPDGPLVIGEQLVEAWAYHTEQYRAQRAAGLH